MFYIQILEFSGISFVAASNGGREVKKSRKKILLILQINSRILLGFL